jgi:3-oxoacyl-[acyl-carrier protein] reductase
MPKALEGLPMIKFKCTDKIALVTGAASGIGLATVERLADSGAHVAVNDLPGARLEETVSALQKRYPMSQLIAVPGDLSDANQARSVAKETLKIFGACDYLINNAGAPFTSSPIPAQELDRLTDDFWDRILKVNLMSAFWLSQALQHTLIAHNGAIVNTVSIAAFGGGGSSVAYATAKSGLRGLTRELARGFAPKVRVNGIAPGFVRSNWECSFGDIDTEAKRSVPLGRAGEPHDYAELIVYLCLGAAYITGEVIEINGGIRI